jgi:hypothetical protein
MRKLWHRVEMLLVNSRLRLPIYIITIISGVGFFIAPSIFVATFFVTFLGLLLIFESIHPTGSHSFSKIQITILILLKIFGIILGVFLMFIGIGVEIGRHLH